MKVRVRTHEFGHAGFTLLEVVFALAILLIGMTVVLSLLTFGAALSRTANLRSTSASAVEAVVADLEETLFPLEQNASDSGFSGLTVGEPEPIIRRVLPGYPRILYSATATENPDHPLEYKVVIDMTWSAAGVQRTQRYQTILLRQLPYGERLRRLFVEKTPIKSGSGAGSGESSPATQGSGAQTAEAQTPEAQTPKAQHTETESP